MTKKPTIVDLLKEIAKLRAPRKTMLEDSIVGDWKSNGGHLERGEVDQDSPVSDQDQEQ